MEEEFRPFFMGNETMTDEVIQEASSSTTTATPTEVVNEFQLPVSDYQEEEQVEFGDKVKEYLENPPLIQKMLNRIDEVDAYSWARGELGGLDWGTEKLNEAFEGLNTGVHLFAGNSNIGKSSFMLWLGWNIALHNRQIDEKHNYKAFVLMFTLDDTCNELMPRLVALDQNITINSVAKPKKYEHLTKVMDKREQGLQDLREATQNYAMIDANEGTSIEHIEKVMDEYHEMLEARYPGEYKLVTVIDNFHDVSVEERGYTEENARIDYVAKRLDELSVKYDSPLLCTAEFRKINTFKRPQQDDLKGSAKLIYVAKAIILLHNDVSTKQEQAQVYWSVTDGDEEIKMPVYECQVSKNKFGSFKGHVYYRFTPDKSHFVEASDDESKKYTTMITA
ncbi:DnaB-like helicase C-terminal domain-containing protein [Tetragenococcus halophilus]|uniref:DnaB-like helicase C-terminal domain-containing protein n=1 Tax=Tetragenococcus halophilus TaxID=51669 RepID=UPI00300FD179